MTARARVGLLLACCAVVALLYAPALTAFFVADDFVLLHGLQDGSTGLAAIGMRPGAPFLRPLLGALFWAEHRGLGAQPWHMHLIGIALHALAAWGLGLFVARWTGQALAGATAALLFASSPLAPEAVTWISARGYPLAAVAIVAMLGLLLRQAQEPRRARVLGGAALALAALLAVEPAFPLAAYPVLLGWATVRGWRGLRGFCAGVVVATGAYLALRLWWIGGLGGYQGDGRHAQFELAKTLGYLRAAALHLLAPGPWDVAEGAWLGGLVGASALGAAVVFAAANWSRELGKRLTALAGCALAALSITATWATLAADLSGVRYLYFANLFWCSALGVAAASSQRAAFARVAIALLLAGQLAATVVVNLRWREAGALAEAAVRGASARVDAGARHLLLYGAPTAYRGVHVLPWAVDAAVFVFGRGARVDVLESAAAWENARAMWRAAPDAQRQAIAVGRWDAASRAWVWE